MTDQNSPFPNWVKDAIFYQIFPERFFNGDPSNDPKHVEPWGNLPSRTNFFGGDLQGILDKLDYLQDLGVNALYLNPIFKAHTNHKYDTTDYLQIDPAFGTNALFIDFVGELHRRGMRIVLDGVFNHSGDGFWAFEDLVAKGEKSKYKDWYFVRSFPITKSPLSYYTCGGADYLPKLNVYHPEVKEYIFSVATHWLRGAGIDGWRLDTPCKIPFEFWREFRKEVKAINPDAYLVGEIWRDAGPWIKGDVFDGITNYRLRDLIIGFCSTGILDAEDFAYEVEHLHSTLGEAGFSMLNLLGCHDTPRVLTLFNGEVDRLLIAMVFMMTTVGAPLIYYGDEIGMLGENDPDCRRTMEWDQSRWNRRIYDLTRALTHLRNEHPALRRGTFESLLSFYKLYVYKRTYEGDEVIVILNPGPAVRELVIPTKSKAKHWQDVFADRVQISGNGSLTFEIIESNTYRIFTAK